ncbi:MAG: hypothetical protein LBJ11_08330 [Oscillospiraceae bacterium]|jgi:hypothetical protein|nr:hypothetical protein [Oscillospiraceae bacterium]
MKLKRIAVLLAALLLAALAAGCAKETPVANTGVSDGANTYWWGEEISSQPDEPQFPSEADSTEPSSDAGTLPGETPGTAAPGTTKTPVVVIPGTTAKPAAPGQTTTKPATTKSTTTKPTTATAKPATTKPTTAPVVPTKVYPNPISITSKDNALSVFNASVKKVVSEKPGFGKSHNITFGSWQLDPALLGGYESLIPLPADQVNNYISSMLNSSLGSGGLKTATASKGYANQIIRESAWAMSDLKDVTYAKDGANWIVTITVNDGNTRQQKKFLSSGITGNSPIDKGPLHMATGDGSLYDHMTADRVFALIKANAGKLVDPIDISEITNQIKFVATIDGGGYLVRLTADYHQQFTLGEVTVVTSGQGVKDQTGSANVHIVYSDFNY